MFRKTSNISRPWPQALAERSAVTGGAGGEVGFQHFERARDRVDADQVAVAQLGEGPPLAASGATWMAAGTLPEAPDMRPSVTSATFSPRSCRTDEGGREASGVRASRWPSGPGSGRRRPCRSVNSPALKAAFTPSWSWKMRARGFDRSGVRAATAETLITPRPRLPVSCFRPPVGWKGSEAGRRILSLSVVLGAVFPGERRRP